jgi:hypothetical protein
MRATLFGTEEIARRAARAIMRGARRDRHLYSIPRLRRISTVWAAVQNSSFQPASKGRMLKGNGNLFVGGTECTGSR